MKRIVGTLAAILAVIVLLVSPAMAEAEVIGYWDQTWKGAAYPPEGANVGIALSGWADPSRALMDSVYYDLIGDKYISLGGGNTNGQFNSSNLDTIITAIETDRFSAYDGIAFDIEECGQEGLSRLFQEAFSATKDQGMKVLVSVSHSAPYECSDADALMDAFFADPNIDYLSPQLYSSGIETENDYDLTFGTETTWEDYAGAEAAIVPSIVTANLYEDAVDYFSENYGITLDGFIQWNNDFPPSK